MFKMISIVIVALIAAVLGLAVTQPDTFRVERSATIKAPPEKVYRLLNDFHQWPQWSPWERMDPAMQRTHGGAQNGIGATYAWEGNKKVGKGRMEIVESVPPSKVTIKLDFLAPFEAHNTAEFLLTAQGDATTVTWAMTGPNMFLAKVMSVFASMDRMVGKDFESGLANLKAIAEK